MHYRFSKRHYLIKHGSEVGWLPCIRRRDVLQKWRRLWRHFLDSPVAPSVGLWFLFCGAIWVEVFPTRSTDLRALELRLSNERNALWLVVSAKWKVLWTEFNSASKVMKDSWVKRDQLDVTCFISLLNSQHVSDVNTSFLRSLRLMCWVISWVAPIWFDVCWSYVVVWLWWCGIRMH